MPKATGLARREFLLGAAGVLATPYIVTPAQAAGQTDERRLSFHNPHTNENFDAVYFSKGQYDEQAMREFYRIARDWRQEKEVKIDNRTINIAYNMQKLLEQSTPLMLVSGYRTPKTNRLVHGATHSFHMRGEALDITHPHVSTSMLHKVALRIRGGGVGYYPSEHFVHVDCGPVRTWRG